MPVKHLDLPLLRSFAAAKLPAEVMLRAGRHLSSCGACRARLRSRVQNGAAILKRLHLEEDRSLEPTDYEQLFDRLSARTFQDFERTAREKSAAPLLLRQFVHFPIAEQASALRGDARFHIAAFVEALLEAARDAWRDDQASSERLGRLGLDVAERLDRTIYGHGLVNDLKARAWSYVANARRIFSDLRGAEEAFQDAERLLGEGSGDPLEWARLLDLKASLRRAQRRFREALDLLDQVVGIYRRTHEGHLEGRALIGKALIYDYSHEPEKAVPFLTEARCKIDVGQEPGLLFTVLHNLARSYVTMGDYESARALLPEARQAAIEVGTADDLTLTLWVEGQLDLETGQLVESERKLQAVQAHYVQIGIGYKAALAALDLAKVYILQGRTAETKRLAAEMHTIFVSRDVQREAIAALLVFQQAIEQERASVRLIDEVIRRVKEAQTNLRPERPA